MCRSCLIGNRVKTLRWIPQRRYWSSTEPVLSKLESQAIWNAVIRAIGSLQVLPDRRMLKKRDTLDMESQDFRFGVAFGLGVINYEWHSVVNLQCVATLWCLWKWEWSIRCIVSWTSKLSCVQLITIYLRTGWAHKVVCNGRLCRPGACTEYNLNYTKSGFLGWITTDAELRFCYVSCHVTTFSYSSKP